MIAKVVAVGGSELQTAVYRGIIGEAAADTVGDVHFLLLHVFSAAKCDRKLGDSVGRLLRPARVRP